MDSIEPSLWPVTVVVACISSSRYSPARPLAMLHILLCIIHPLTLEQPYITRQGELLPLTARAATFPLRSGRTLTDEVNAFNLVNSICGKVKM